MVVASRTGRSDRLRVLVRGLLLWILGLSSAAYLSLTTTWFVVLERRPVNYVTWVDCVLAPFRWEQIKLKRGEAFADEGLAALEERRWSEAVLKIQAGLARAPHYGKARRNLGLFFLAAGHRQRSLSTLIGGFEGFYPGRDSVELIMQIALSGEDYTTVVDLLDHVLATSGAAVERDREWLVDQKSRVLILAQRYAENLAWIAAQTTMTDVRHESKVVSLIELRRFDEARTALADWEQGSGVLGGVRRLMVRLERETGNLASMRTALAGMRDRASESPGPWIYSVVQESLANQPAAARAALDVFLMRFGLNRDSILMAAKPLKEIQSWELFDQLMAFATDSRIDDFTLVILRIEAALERGRPGEARAELKAYHASQKTALPARDLAWYEIMIAWIDELDGEDEAAAERLVVTLQTTPFDLNFGRKVADLLEEYGRVESALRVWQVVRQEFPASQQALAEVERLGTQLGETVRTEITLPKIRDGDPLDIDEILKSAEDELPREIAIALQSARLFFARTGELMAAQRWSELDRLLRELRRMRPLWISAHERSIREVEIELNIGDGNWPALVSNIRLQLDGSIDRAIAAMKVARQVDALGQRTAASSVLVEIERRHQSFPPAKRLRDDWAAAAAAAAAEIQPPAEPLDLLPVIE